MFQLLGHHLGADALVEHDVVVAARHRRTERLPGSVRGVGSHRHARHALDAARDRDVVASRHDALRGEVRGLLAGSALPVDRGAGHRLRKSRRQHRVARDVVSLLADLPDAARDHVVHQRRVQLVSLHQGLQRMCQQIHGMPAFQRAIAPADGGSNRIYNHSFTHVRHGSLCAARHVARATAQSARVMRYLRIAHMTPAASSNVSELHGANGHVET